MKQDSYSKTLRENLRAIRKGKGLTTTDIAKILGVSQAKVSYIETGRGVLSARDVAILSRQLGVPVVEFFRGLEKAEDASGRGELANQLANFGAKFLAKPAGIPLTPTPFEEVFAKAIGFVDDDRFHKAFCVALILQAASREINVDRIFALTGNNPFLVKRIAREVQLCLEIIEHLNSSRKLVAPRAKRQLERIGSEARSLGGTESDAPSLALGEIAELASLVEECIDAKE